MHVCMTKYFFGVVFNAHQVPSSRYMQAVGTFLFANHFYSFALKFYKNCEREVTLDVTMCVYIM